jgi:protease PrsW
MKVLRRGWFQTFAGGLILLFLVEWALVATHNPNYIPSVIVLGAFLVPVAFVSYLYERLQNWGVRLRPVVLCFVWGGVLGTVVAGFLEYHVAVTLGFLPKIAIGLIEELAKLIVPLIFYFLGRYRSEAAGIVLGVASGMGFAAFETMGYGFVSLMQSRGNLVFVDWVLLLRGLLSPAGQASWTGLVRCAVARETEGWTCCAELERGSHLLDRRDPSRLVGHPGEQREFYRRRVRCYGVSELAGGSDQPDFADPPRA